MPLLKFDNLMGSPLGMAGLGLLMQPQQSYQPINPMAGIAQGMYAAGQYRQNEAESQIAQQRAEMERQRMQYEMEESMRKREQDALAQAETERQRKAQADYIATLPPEQQALAMAMGPSAFAGEAGKRMFADPKETWSEPYLDNSTGKPILVQRSSTTGQLRSVGSGGIEINMPGTQKPLEDKAIKYVMPDGSTPPATATAEDVVSAGGRLLTPAEVNAQQRSGTITADKVELEAKYNDALAKYEQAKSAFEASKTPQTIRDLNNAAADLRTAKTGLENWRGEPSEGIGKRWSIPGAAGVFAEDLISPFFGSQAAQPTTQADYDALPSGATYIDPEDGQTYRKP